MRRRSGIDGCSWRQCLRQAGWRFHALMLVHLHWRIGPCRRRGTPGPYRRIPSAFAPLRLRPARRAALLPLRRHRLHRRCRLPPATATAAAPAAATATAAAARFPYPQLPAGKLQYDAGTDTVSFASAASFQGGAAVKGGLSVDGNVAVGAC